MDKKVIGEKISKCRKEKGLTQKELADMLHVTDKTVSKWETGVNFPDIAIMEKLADALDIRVTDLLGLQDTASEEVIKEIALISIEEKNEIKKGIRSRSVMMLICIVYLMFAEICLYLELVKIGLGSGIYGSFTIGLLGTMGTILGGSLYSIINAKKL